MPPTARRSASRSAWSWNCRKSWKSSRCRSSSPTSQFLEVLFVARARRPCHNEVIGLNRLTLFLIVLVLTTAARPLVAQEAKPTTQQLVASLVAQLDDAAPDVRQRAQDRLVDLGP